VCLSNTSDQCVQGHPSTALVQIAELNKFARCISVLPCAHSGLEYPEQLCGSTVHCPDSSREPEITPRLMALRMDERCSPVSCAACAEAFETG
jgi:hypothetical protein